MAILSFSKNFIFIKTRKTAGTSIQDSLKSFCNKKDIITLGWTNLKNKKRCCISEFASLKNMEDNFKINSDKFFKFGFTRNPYSIVLSRYLFQVRKKRF